MDDNRPSQLIIGVQVVGLVALVIAGALTADTADWDMALLGILLAFAIFTDLTAVTTTSKVRLSGSFLPIVVAMVLLGGPPAALIGLIVITIDWLTDRKALHLFINNLLTYGAFPLITGLVFHWITVGAGITQSDPAFYALVAGADRDPVEDQTRD
jgi:hypothetical protein